MQRSKELLAVLFVIVLVQAAVIATLLRSGPAREAQTVRTAPVAAKPSRLEAIPDSKLKRVVLTAKAAERVGIATSAVSLQNVTRNLVVAGEVIAGEGTGQVKTAAAGKSHLIRVPYSGDTARLDATKSARVFRLGKGDAALSATPVDVRTEASGAGSGNGNGIHYRLEAAADGPALGERVRVEVPYSGSGEVRLVVAHSAVIYDANGLAWVYTNPAPLAYVRDRVDIDFVEGDLAVLKSGPAKGVPVVTVGASLLWGAELGK